MAAENLRKAAILLDCLPKEQAAQLLARLAPQQAEAAMAEMARLGPPSGTEQQAVVHELASANASAAGRNERQDSALHVPFHALAGVDSQDWLVVFEGEHPQTIALVLAHLPRDIAAQVVRSLPAHIGLAVIRRVADLQPPSLEVLQQVERFFAERVANLPSRTPGMAPGPDRVAEILCAMDGATEQALLQSLTNANPALVEEIRWQQIASEVSRKAA